MLFMCLVFFTGMRGEAFSQTASSPLPAVAVNYLYGFDAKLSGSVLKWVDQIYMDERHGEIFLLDKDNGRIVVMDMDGIYQYHFNYLLSGVKNPRSLAVDAGGDIYVAEIDRIAVLDYRGDFKKELKISGVPDADKMAIRSIALYKSREGARIYVGDITSQRIIVLTLDGKFVSQYGQDVIKGTNFAGLTVSDGGITFLDSSIYTVFRYGHDGTLIAKWGGLSSLFGGFSMPSALAVDEKNGRVIVADTNRMMVIAFDMTGKPLFEFGGPSIFSWPRAVAVDGAGRIYVADATGVIKVFEGVLEKMDSTEPQISPLP